MNEKLWVAVVTCGNVFEEISLNRTEVGAMQFAVECLANVLDYAPTGNWDEDLDKIDEIIEETEDGGDWNYTIEHVEVSP